MNSKMKPEDFGVKTKYICSVGEKLAISSTGEWKIWPPVIDQAKCVQCGACALSCPVQAMREENERLYITLDYCKGCGVCICECPKEAIFFDKKGESNG